MPVRHGGLRGGGHCFKHNYEFYVSFLPLNAPEIVHTGPLNKFWLWPRWQLQVIGICISSVTMFGRQWITLKSFLILRSTEQCPVSSNEILVEKCFLQRVVYLNLNGLQISLYTQWRSVICSRRIDARGNACSAVGCRDNGFSTQFCTVTRWTVVLC